MTLEIAVAKLTGLKKSLTRGLESRFTSFNVAHVGDFFSRYSAIRDYLRTEHQELFGDISSRSAPTVSIPSGSIRYIERADLELFYSDVSYCLDTLDASKTTQPSIIDVTREGVFFAGQYYDAFKSLSSVLRAATKKIEVIDGYINEKVIDYFTDKEDSVSVNILSKSKSVTPKLKTAIGSFNKQYGKLEIRTCEKFHDRFVVIDDKDHYHFGASIKDLGSRGFMFSRIEEPFVISQLSSELRKEWAQGNLVK